MDKLTKRLAISYPYMSLFRKSKRTFENQSFSFRKVKKQSSAHVIRELRHNLNVALAAWHCGEWTIKNNTDENTNGGKKNTLVKISPPPTNGLHCISQPRDTLIDSYLHYVLSEMSSSKCFLPNNLWRKDILRTWNSGRRINQRAYFLLLK